MEFEREARAALPQRHARAIFIELIAMVAEEDKVALVVQCDRPACCKIWHLREETGEHAADSMAQHSIEVVHDKLGV